jgi:hypothetical protein
MGSFFENLLTKQHKNSWRVRNAYIQTYRQAEAVGEFILDRYSVPIQYIRLTGCRGIPWLEVGDRITVDAPNIDSSRNAYFITSISWSYGADEPYKMDIQAIRVRDLYQLYDVDDDGNYADYARIDTSRYGTGQGHGHLFY